MKEMQHELEKAGAPTQRNPKRPSSYAMTAPGSPLMLTDSIGDLVTHRVQDNKDVVRVLQAPPYLIRPEVIGRGSYGVVAKFHKTNATAFRPDIVAVKCQFVAYGSAKREVKNVLRELSVAAFSRHPNVLGLLGCYSSHSEPNGMHLHFVMPYMPLDLHVVIGNARCWWRKCGVRDELFASPAKRRNIFFQIARGLHYLHSNGIVHLDLKPSNVLVDYTNNAWCAKLADFGHTQDVESWTEHHHKYITLWYRPPEMLDVTQTDVLCEAKLRYKPDMWSLGCIFAELASGVPLFKGSDEEDVLDRVRHTMGMHEDDPCAGKIKGFLNLWKHIVQQEWMGDDAEVHADVLLMHKLLNHDVTERIGCDDVLKYDIAESSRNEDSVPFPENLRSFDNLSSDELWGLLRQRVRTFAMNDGKKTKKRSRSTDFDRSVARRFGGCVSKRIAVS